MTETAVRISDLRKQFGRVLAIDGMDLEIRVGEIFGLLGPNGAGKTTTIKILMGLTKPSSGRADVLGVNPAEEPRAVRALAGYAMQQTAVDLYLTGRENLLIFADLFNLPPGRCDQRTDDVLEWAGLEGAADRLVMTYSGGMKRRLNLALSLLHRPRLFFLDEPTLGLDVYSRRRLWQLIDEVKASGTTVVLSTHNLAEANELCDRVAILDHGRIVALGTPASLKQRVVNDLHRLTITFSQQPPPIDEIAPPIRALTEGSRLTLTGSAGRLWELLYALRARHGEAIQRIRYTEPSLDDVVMRLTRPDVGTPGDLLED